MTVPWPPYMLVPPMMTAAMIESSVPVPAAGCAEAKREAMRMPASAETALQNRLAVSAAVSRMPSRNSA